MNYPIKQPNGNDEKRSTGGQPGNSNAYKHGFYSARLHPEEKQELEENLSGNLQADIDLLTVAIDDYLKKTAGDQPRTWDQLLVQLRAVTLAAAAKATLIRGRSSMAKKIAEITDTEAWLADLVEEEEK
jgi:hypothetical protein